jgi:hypothetical protein
MGDDLDDFQINEDFLPSSTKAMRSNDKKNTKRKRIDDDDAADHVQSHDNFENDNNNTNYTNDDNNDNNAASEQSNQQKRKNKKARKQSMKQSNPIQPTQQQQQRNNKKAKKINAATQQQQSSSSDEPVKQLTKSQKKRAKRIAKEKLLKQQKQQERSKNDAKKNVLTQLQQLQQSAATTTINDTAPSASKKNKKNMPPQQVGTTALVEAIDDNNTNNTDDNDKTDNSGTNNTSNSSNTVAKRVAELASRYDADWRCAGTADAQLDALRRQLHGVVGRKMTRDEIDLFAPPVEAFVALPDSRVDADLLEQLVDVVGSRDALCAATWQPGIVRIVRSLSLSLSFRSVCLCDCEIPSSPLPPPPLLLHLSIRAVLAEEVGAPLVLVLCVSALRACYYNDFILRDIWKVVVCSFRDPCNLFIRTIDRDRSMITITQRHDEAVWRNCAPSIAPRASRAHSSPNGRRRSPLARPRGACSDCSCCVCACVGNLLSSIYCYYYYYYYFGCSVERLLAENALKLNRLRYIVVDNWRNAKSFTVLSLNETRAR